MDRHPYLPVFATIDEWQRISGDRRSTTYEKLADGRLRGIKDNGRTKIDVEHGLAQMRALPAVKIRPAVKREKITA